MNPKAAEKPGIKPFDAADYLQSDEDCALYLQACIEEAPDDAALVSRALGDIARARGMTQLARDTGLSRESLYKSLSGERAPNSDTLFKVMKALGFKLTVLPIAPVQSSSTPARTARACGLN